MSLRQDLPAALTYVWLVVSAVLMIAVVLPLVLPAEAVFGVFSECEARSRGGECALCGMTTAYVAIAGGDFAGARRANSGAMPLYFGSIVNFAAAAAYFFMRKRRTWAR